MEKSLSSVAGKIRRLEARDIDAVVEIQTQCPEASQWSRKEYETLARDAAPCWVAENNGRVVGFLAARELADEMEILNVAVASASRRQGIASQLLLEAVRWGAANGTVRVYLEVRASNAAAMAFYQSRKFRASGMRPRYYRDPADDAVLLAATVNNE
jgi:ribosomal-protein-alanine acetyltransferase